jgi:hypothetical protein
MTTPNPLRFRIDNVRASFPVLFKGEQFQGTGSFRCGVSLIIPPDHPQLAQINAAIEEAARVKWKDKAALTLKGARAKDKVCLRDGDYKSKYDGHAGNWILGANCPGGETEAECAKPSVFDKLRREYVSADRWATLNEKERQTFMHERQCPIYSGCYVSALVEFYADSRYGDGVFCKLVGIQFYGDGDAFSGGAPASADEFDTVTEGADASDFA